MQHKPHPATLHGVPENIWLFFLTLCPLAPNSAYLLIQFNFLFIFLFKKKKKPPLFCNVCQLSDVSKT